jgi:hypothetical protein
LQYPRLGWWNEKSILVLKEQAKEIAIMVLNDRICDAPTHSNPLVQAMIEELLQ